MERPDELQISTTETKKDNNISYNLNKAIASTSSFKIFLQQIILNDRPRLLSHIQPTNQKSDSVAYNKPDIDLLTANQSGISLFNSQPIWHLFTDS